MKVISLSFLDDPETSPVILGYIEDHDDIKKVIRKIEEEQGYNLLEAEESAKEFLVFYDSDHSHVVTIEKVERFMV